MDAERRSILDHSLGNQRDHAFLGHSELQHHEPRRRFLTNQLTFVAGGITLQVPVVVQLFNLNATKMVADPNRNMIYALHPGSGGRG